MPTKSAKAWADWKPIRRLLASLDQYGRYIDGGVFQDRVRHRNRAEIAAGAVNGIQGAACYGRLRSACCIGYRSARQGWTDQERSRPIGKRHSRIAVAVRQEITEAVADRNAVPVAVHAGQCGQDIRGGV